MKLGFWTKLKRVFSPQYWTAARLVETVETLGNGETITKLVLVPVLAGHVVALEEGDAGHYILLTTRLDLNEVSNA